MCGIIGISGKKPVSSRLLSGLGRLEYRGYDSAGIALPGDGAIARRRATGKLANLQAAFDENPCEGTCGIGHTRWATHGGATHNNAHPHATERVALVHNGIIENFPELRQELRDVTLTSETDTEIVVHLIDAELARGKSPEAAMQTVLPRLQGAFALVVAFRDHPDLLIAARRGSPLALGVENGEGFVGSDAIALAGLSRDITYLENGDRAVVRRDLIRIYDADNTPVTRPTVANTVQPGSLDKGRHPHAMRKEIFEQPRAIGDTLHALIDPVGLTIDGASAPVTMDTRPPIIQFSACGTAYYATLVAGYWFEEFCAIPVRHEIASELRYRSLACPKGSLGIFVSQSGETMDTIEAMRHWKTLGGISTAIVNVDTSSLAREADHSLRTLAGPEVSVASTKAFTTQLTALLCLSVWMGQQSGQMTSAQVGQITRDMLELPGKLVETLGLIGDYRRIARERLSQAKGVFFLGRGLNYPIALEGALKLKEITYMHADGYPTGEMKHGPLALVTPDVPCVCIAPSDRWFEKNLNNIREIAARGGQVILLTDSEGAKRAADHEIGDATEVIVHPTIPECLAPIVYALPVQLLAYETAGALGREIDKPRNLAKSVTVE